MGWWFADLYIKQKSVTLGIVTCWILGSHLRDSLVAEVVGGHEVVVA